MIISKYIPNWAFFIPLSYVKYTRLGDNILKSMSLAIIYFIPTLYSLLLNNGFSYHTIFTYITSSIALYTLYEMGYIQNDAETIKKEDMPTIRLYANNLVYYERHKSIIYITRVIIAVILCILLLFIVGVKSIGGWLFVLSLFLMVLVYLVYNSIRNIYNLPLFFILVLFRYMSYFLICIPKINYKIVLLLFVAFPLCNIFEIASKSRYNIKFLNKYINNRITLFRVIYYFVLSIIFIGLTLFGVYSIVETLLILYFFSYRIVVYFFDKFYE